MSDIIEGEKKFRKNIAQRFNQLSKGCADTIRQRGGDTREDDG